MAVQHRETVRKPRESFEAAIWRLAGEAYEAGIKLYHSGCMWFATSQSDPELLHRVTLYSCDCLGFQHHQRCRHLAALLWQTGNMPERQPEPEPPAPAAVKVTTDEACLVCHGTGSEWLHIWTANGAQAIELQCSRCHGAATVAA